MAKEPKKQKVVIDLADRVADGSPRYGKSSNGDGTWLDRQTYTFVTPDHVMRSEGGSRTAGTPSQMAASMLDRMPVYDRCQSVRAASASNTDG